MHLKTKKKKKNRFVCAVLIWKNPKKKGKYYEVEFSWCNAEIVCCYDHWENVLTSSKRVYTKKIYFFKKTGFWTSLFNLCHSFYHCRWQQIADRQRIIHKYSKVFSLNHLKILIIFNFNWKSVFHFLFLWI